MTRVLIDAICKSRMIRFSDISGPEWKMTSRMDIVKLNPLLTFFLVLLSFFDIKTSKKNGGWANHSVNSQLLTKFRWDDKPETPAQLVYVSISPLRGVLHCLWLLLVMCALCYSLSAFDQNVYTDFWLV